MLFKFTMTEQVNHLGTTLTTEYKGFTHLITKRNVRNHMLIVAWLEGDAPEYWIVEGETGLQELSRLYMDLIGEVPEFTRMKHEDNR